MSKSLIITFEGIEGSGKTLHINNVSRYLSKKKINFLKLREPGGSKNAELIRKIILNKKSNFNQKTDLLLYLASRSENIDFINNKKIKPKIILIDRFVDSTIAYQHYGMNLDNKIINILNKYILGNKKVDFTFLHTVNNKNLKKRLSKRKTLNRYDRFKLSFYKKVQNGFIKLTKMNKKKYHIVDSNNKINENKKLIIKKIDSLIKIK
tara:strand:- start:1038 stop:1661 length:624 start_codon:yes stop_codon:yes gene_type:complete